MREWLVASGIIEGPEGLLLVQNRRRDGRVDWTTPGGVIETAAGESVRDGLTREVREETGIEVTEWDGPVYEVETIAAGLGWHLRVEVHRAVEWRGDISLDDPDGIVVDARFVALEGCATQLEGCARWVREPIEEWLAERWSDRRAYGYRLEGADRDSMVVTRH